MVCRIIYFGLQAPRFSTCGRFPNQARKNQKPASQLGTAGDLRADQNELPGRVRLRRVPGPASSTVSSRAESIRPFEARSTRFSREFFFENPHEVKAQETGWPNFYEPSNSSADTNPFLLDLMSGHYENYGASG